MTISGKNFIHNGLKLFWDSNGVNKSGISPALAKVIRLILVHLNTAQSMSDVKVGVGVTKGFKALTGHKHRFELEVNGNWRITFDCIETDMGLSISKVDLEDVHRKGGAKKHD